MKENRKKTVIKKSSVGYAQCRIIRDNNGNSVDYRFISVNDCFWQLMGLEGSVLIGKTILQIDPNTEKAWIEICGNVALSGESEQFESYSSDSGKYVETTICSTNIGEFAIIIVDITARKHLENALKESENRLIAAQKMAHVGNWELNLETKKMWASEEAFNLYGIDYTSEYISFDLARKSILPAYHDLMDQSLQNLIQQKGTYNIEFELKNQMTGELHYVHSIGSLILNDDGKPWKVSGTIQDITENKLKEEKIQKLNFYDQLTGLFNRRFYEEELIRTDKKENLPLTLLIGDVNGLKLINDSFGHDMGDALLKKAAAIIIEGCPTNAVISRIGGDEFVVLLPRTNGIEIEKMIKRIKARALIEKVGSMHISISFGYETKVREHEKIKEVFKKAEDRMYHNKLFESPSMRGKTVKTIIKTLYEKNKREEQHSHRVSKLCEEMGEALELSEIKINELKTVGLLHDIGKIAIDEKILNKPGKLTAEEQKEIERHSEIGYRILSTVNEMAEMAEFVLAHQEKWDGSGYPKGLKATKIPFESRIIAIADAYDAMTSDRVYRSKMTIKMALEELLANAGTQFDPALVDLFIKKVVLKE
ncbi:HD domain-containing phosphohydrolase [Acetobacterium woodii]|uniref:Sensory box-containing diguanylate cyclase n=1 Tax=Acetobacterium woodii (strain ATCC 29683 / DSM 1030 / JCM 2381 / KCTC 1655 / WB1) TaxID=931626 RepID=H6LJV2_ACEWD|nr:HD domain-containing phosphohydrolase [Acetobacterium woodii]AFA47503.1 sensory box-containing diguanylate cyclase [Acetobacterium woodii DSM 1030]